MRCLFSSLKLGVLRCEISAEATGEKEKGNEVMGGRKGLNYLSYPKSLKMSPT